MSAQREVWITGVGLLSSLGEGLEAHWAGLAEPGARPVLDAQTYAPFLIHPLAPVELDRQIPKKGDQRQMEAWQRIGVYAAGLALDEAGLARDADLLARTHMIVAAGGGERDSAVDAAVVSGLVAAGETGGGRVLNERLSGDLRPTLFLAQLSNLLAGNISIVHGVTGSSRTFMGEEAAGAEAAKVAFARLAHRQGDVALIGGSYNAARHDLLLLYELGNALLKHEHRPVWSREPGSGGSPGFVPGSLGAFLVLEAREHAEKRRRRGLARLVGVASEQSRRTSGETLETARSLWRTLEPNVRDGTLGVLSGATGAEPATAAERSFLEELATGRDVAIRATGSLVGHGIEAQFPLNLGLAALALGRGGFYPPFADASLERAVSRSVRQILVTGFGQWRGEALALLEAID